MTQIFADTGEVLPVTVIEAGPCTVLRVKSEASADGYNALQLGFGDKKVSRSNRPDLGQFKKAGVEGAMSEVREIRVDAATAGGTEQGATLTVADVFEEGQKVDV
ncbi:MAG: 50S ribosomal protein L3, partial [Pseudomonadota bacterium]